MAYKSSSSDAETFEQVIVPPLSSQLLRSQVRSVPSLSGASSSGIFTMDCIFCKSMRKRYYHGKQVSYEFPTA